MNLEKIIELPQVTVNGELEPVMTTRSEDVGALIFGLMTKKPQWAYVINGNNIEVRESGEYLGKINVQYTAFTVQNSRIAEHLQRKDCIVTNSVARIIREVVRFFYPMQAREIFEQSPHGGGIFAGDVSFNPTYADKFSVLLHEVSGHIAKSVLDFKQFFETAYTDEELLAIADERQRIIARNEMRKKHYDSGYGVIVYNDKISVYDNTTGASYFTDSVPENLKSQYGMLKMGEYEHYYKGIGIKKKFPYNGAVYNYFYIEEQNQ